MTFAPSPRARGVGPRGEARGRRRARRPNPCPSQNQRSAGHGAGAATALRTPALREEPLMKTFAASVVSGLVAAAFLAAAEPTPFERGKSALTRGNYDESIAAFSAAIRSEPTSSDAHTGRGIAYAAQGKYD